MTLIERRVLQPLVVSVYGDPLPLDEFQREESRSLLEVRRRAEQYGLSFDDLSLIQIARLNTPDKVQAFLDTGIKYNKGYYRGPKSDSAYSPLTVLKRKKAHCFEGALFAHAVNILHGHQTAIVLLESANDQDHNLCVWQDPVTRLWGANSNGLSGRKAEYTTLAELAQSYKDDYKEGDHKDDSQSKYRNPMLVGYSDPIDIFKKYGSGWVTRAEDLWDIYWTYVDDRTVFHDINVPSKTHLYPFVFLVKEGYIGLDEKGKGVVYDKLLPSGVQNMLDLWGYFYRRNIRNPELHQDILTLLDRLFYKRMHVTPKDLYIHAQRTLPDYYKYGYSLDSIITN